MNQEVFASPKIMLVLVNTMNKSDIVEFGIIWRTEKRRLPTKNFLSTSQPAGSPSSSYIYLFQIRKMLNQSLLVFCVCVRYFVINAECSVSCIEFTQSNLHGYNHFSRATSHIPFQSASAQHIQIHTYIFYLQPKLGNVLIRKNASKCMGTGNASLSLKQTRRTAIV